MKSFVSEFYCALFYSLKVPKLENFARMDYGLILSNDLEIILMFDVPIINL